MAAYCGMRVSSGRVGRSPPDNLETNGIGRDGQLLETRWWVRAGRAWERTEHLKGPADDRHYGGCCL